MQQGAAKLLWGLIYSAAAVGAIWLGVRFLLPWLAPFIVAYSAAALLERPVRALIRRGWHRAAASGVLTVMLLAALACAAVFLTLKGVESATDFAKEVPALMHAASQGLSALQERAAAYCAAAPEGVSEYLDTALSSVYAGLSSLPGMLSAWALNFIARAAQATPDTLLFIITAGIGSYFISAAFPKVTGFILLQLPDGFRRRLTGVVDELRYSFGGLLRAQLILTLITFFELLIAFFALGVENAVGIAAVTAAVDALPVFGTGIVLAPWAAYSLLLGNVPRAIELLISWGIVTLVRSCTQAKLLGDQIGLDPIASLLAMYVGWRVCGVWGMLLFPLILVTLHRLNGKGVIHLWKSE